MKLAIQIQEIDNGFFVQIAGHQDPRTGQMMNPPRAIAAETMDDVIAILKQVSEKNQNGEPANTILLKPQSKLRTE